VSPTAIESSGGKDMKKKPFYRELTRRKKEQLERKEDRGEILFQVRYLLGDRAIPVDFIRRKLFGERGKAPSEYE